MTHEQQIIATIHRRYCQIINPTTDPLKVIVTIGVQGRSQGMDMQFFTIYENDKAVSRYAYFADYYRAACRGDMPIKVSSKFFEKTTLSY